MERREATKKAIVKESLRGSKAIEVTTGTQRIVMSSSTGHNECNTGMHTPAKAITVPLSISCGTTNIRLFRTVTIRMLLTITRVQQRTGGHQFHHRLLLRHRLQSLTATIDQVGTAKSNLIKIDSKSIRRKIVFSLFRDTASVLRSNHIVEST